MRRPSRGASSQPGIFDHNCDGDESWCFAHDPTTKRQSVEWTGQRSPRPQKLRWEKSRVKTMLIAFFDSRGMIHTEFVPPGQTVNVDFYKRVLDQLLKRIARVWPYLNVFEAWCLLHDNAPSHNALLIRQFLAKENVTLLHHSPYLPDLAPADYFLFPRFKIHLKGHRFDDVSAIQKAVTCDLKAILVSDFTHTLNR